MLKSLKYLKKINYLEFLILGSDHNYTKEIDNFKFIFRKFTNNKTTQRLYHSSSDLLIMPSRAESLPQFAVESILCKKAVVCFNIGGFNEIIEHKKNGYLAKPFSEIDFSDGIKFCLNNNLYTNNFKRRNLANKFNKEKILKDYSKIYAKILNHK